MSPPWPAAQGQHANQPPAWISLGREESPGFPAPSPQSTGPRAALAQLGNKTDRLQDEETWGLEAGEAPGGGLVHLREHSWEGD